MGKVGEDNSLIYGTQHMLFIVIGSQTDECPLGKCILIGSVQKRQENDLVILRFNRIHPCIGYIIYGTALFLCFRINHSIFPAEVGLISSIR